MAASRKNWLFAVCLGTALVFFAQSMFCFAEDAEVIRCAEGAEQHQGAGSCQEQSNAHCGYAHCHGAVITTHAFDLWAISLHGKISLNPDTLVPDGPVRDIEHPPQLS